MKATIVDLRYRMKDVLKAVERGEPVTVLHRGKEKAYILPKQEKASAARVRAHAAFGLWTDRRDLANVPEYVRRLRLGRLRDL